jgi:hypothetical protein
MKNALTARMLLAGAVTNWSIFLPGAYQTFLAMHIVQNISEMPMIDVAVGDAGDRIRLLDS